MKRILNLTILYIPIIIMLISSCQHEAIWKPTSNSGKEVCFETEILPIVVSSCALPNCHAAGSEERTLNSYESLMASGYIKKEEASKSKIIKVLSHSDSDERMPPPPNPAWSAERIQLMLDWIEQGAKNTTNCGPACDTTSFTYTKVKGIIDQYCSGCHLSYSTGGGILLDSYSNIKAQAQSGKLSGSIRRLSGFKPMPQGGNQLPECTIRVIEKWIDAGMPEN